jgi:hypothetical protein
VFDLLDNWYRADDFETLAAHFRSALREVDDAWFASLRRHYYPVVGRLIRPGEVGSGCRGGGVQHGPARGARRR